MADTTTQGPERPAGGDVDERDSKTTPRPGAGARTARALWLTLPAFLAYLAISWSAINLFPFSMYRMYSYVADSASQVVVIDAAGKAHRVLDYTAFSCPEDLDLHPSDCAGEERGIGYLENELTAHLEAHRSPPTPAATPVSLARRVWSFPEPLGPPVQVDCVIAECVAVRR